MNEQRRTWWALPTAIVLCCGCSGGDGQHETAPVSGTVTYDGKPVTEGTLHWKPAAKEKEPGKAGAATIENDGSFTVSTYGDGDGAVVGTHTLSYDAPPARPADDAGEVQNSGDSGDTGPPVPSPFAGLVPKTTEVVVDADGTTVEVELVKP